MKTSRVILYDEPAVPEICLDGAAAFVEETFGVPAERRGPILRGCGEGVLRRVAASRISRLGSPFERREPSAGEVEFERLCASDPGAGGGAYYDGFELQGALGGAVPRDELGQDVFHVVFTAKMTCTYDESDGRYHGRAVIGSNPSVISTTGIVEAPAKPRAYYLGMAARARTGADAEAIRERFRGEFLERRDPRLAGVVQGYVMQALFYYETQEAFCGDPDCRLYNSHWQRDLLRSQLEIGALCARHRAKLGELTMT